MAKKTAEKTQKKNNYEGMFLLPAGIGDSERASEAVGKQLDRIEAEVLSIKLWDERRLAYDIAGNKRGIYILTYFNADPLRITELEHDCQLDESILRVLVLRHEHLTKEQIEAPTPASHHPPEEKPAAEAPVEKEKPATETPVEEEKPKELEEAKVADDIKDIKSEPPADEGERDEEKNDETKNETQESDDSDDGAEQEKGEK